jgi:hypothetical protein
VVAGVVCHCDGSGVVPLAGAVAVRLLACRVGLTEGLSGALARRGFAPGHDRGQVWVDVATTLTAGGEAIADIDSLRQQIGLLGPVASPPTVWRVLDEATPAALARVEKARAGFAVTCGVASGAAGLEGGRHRSRRHCGVGCGRHAGRRALG